MKVFVREILQAALMALVIYFASLFMVQNTKIDGISMDPSLHNGNYVVLNKTAYWLRSIHRGDIIIFAPFTGSMETKDLIKRVIGLPGDTVEIKADGTVYITPAGQTRSYPLKEPYTSRPATMPYGPYVVPADHYFVLGDNRPVSRDSRYIGAIPRSAILGKVVFVTWGLQGWRGAPNYNVVVGNLTADTGRSPALASAP